MDRILLVRHAQAHGHDDADPALSTVGEQQAALLAERLADEPIVRVLSSPRRRAQQTSTAIAERAGLRAEVASLLDDRTPMPSAGRWSDYPEHRWGWLRETPAEEQDEDGVELRSAWTRLNGMLGEDGPAGGTLLIVTHAFVIGSFVASALSAPPSAWMLLPIGNASITEMQRRSNGEIAVVRVNDSGHL
ncbi:histidine phosphatase family protein [Microbacterium bovistercoris]|nr:histidine phosphatase family protein [Microbacterium bovistercoris]